MSNRLLAGSVAAGPAFLGGTFLIAVVRVLRKYNSPKERRKRTVDKNKVRAHFSGDALCPSPITASGRVAQRADGGGQAGTDPRYLTCV